jgi:hypothetical protein
MTIITRMEINSMIPWLLLFKPLEEKTREEAKSQGTAKSTFEPTTTLV